MMKFTKGRVVYIIAAYLICAVGVLCFFLTPSVVDKLVIHRAAILNGTLAAKNFGHLPLDIRQKIYFFHITNPREFLLGAKPNLVQMGPYTFRADVTKKLSWNESMLTFRENRKFWFDAELSNGTLDDEVLTIDPVLASVLEEIDNLPNWVQVILRPIINLREPLIKHTVGEFLYEGYPDTLAKWAHIFNKNLPVIDGKVGFLIGQNDTDDGEFVVFSGEGETINSLNNIVLWKGESTIPYYGEKCNSIWGTNGEMYPPSNPPADRESIFLPIFCKPWNLHKNSSSTLNCLSVTEYSSEPDFFSSTGNVEVDSCYQPRKPAVDGIFDASLCQHGSPVLLSLPHFLKGDPSLRENVLGMSPNYSLHDFTLTMYSPLGIVLVPKVRAQVNIRAIINPKNSSQPPRHVIHPVFWQELVASEESSLKLASLVYNMVELPKLIIRLVALLLSCITFVSINIAICCWRHTDIKEKKEDRGPLIDNEELPPPSFESILAVHT